MAKENLDEKRAAAEADARTYSALGALASSEGGKVLIKESAAKVNEAIESIVLNFQTMTDIEIRTAAATLAANYDLLNRLTSADKNKKFAIDELKKLGGSVEE